MKITIVINAHKDNLENERTRNKLYHWLHAYIYYIVEHYNTFSLSTAFSLSSRTPHNFSFLHLAWVCVLSQMSRDQVEEEPAWNGYRLADGRSLANHRDLGLTLL